jgi:hypothetical protein
MKQTGQIKKILVVANTNVLSNFRLQLFDETKGKGGSCIGSALLDEVGAKETTVNVSEMVSKVIKKYYDFMGYTKLARIIYGLIQDKIQDLRCKEIKKLLFEEYLRKTNNTKMGVQSVTSFFNKA